tara:strand:- start:1968 stop:2135 length:168 start_codon:yes stop_codon:yes gene_type:complete
METRGRKGSEVDIWNIALLYLATSISSVVGEASVILVSVTKEKTRVGKINVMRVA